MVKRLSTDSDGFWEAIKAYNAHSPAGNAKVRDSVTEMLSFVHEKGDEAVRALTKKFDGHEDIALLDTHVLDAAYEACDLQLRDAMEVSAKRIRAYHERQLPEGVMYEDGAGVGLGFRYTPVDAAGLYVPGGTAAYPSSVLMNAIPAAVAGVERIAMVVPTPKGEVNQTVLAAAKIAGVTEIYPVGGAQAVGALAYGTETIARVDKIVGPGNVYVAEAKRQVFGVVGIDTIAGPSEILVIADESANPAWIAADLLSQAEHDVLARSILLSPSATLLEKVEAEVEAMLKQLSRSEIARKSWEKNGLLVQVSDLTEAAQVSDAIAPEHLELMVAEPEKLAEEITHAGALFMGMHTPEAMGDYMAGPSHVLPTSGAARFSSGLSVFDFLKRTSLINYSATAFNEMAKATETFAESEGLTAHALSVSIRKN